MFGASFFLALRGVWGAIPGSIKIGALAAVAALLAAWAIHHHGVSQGRQEAAVSAAKAIAQAYKDRSDENTTVDALDRAALCLELGGLPDDCRAGLRGVGADQSPADDGGLPRR